MSAGSGEGRRVKDPIQRCGRSAGAINVATADAVTRGSEQQLQKWQLGGHWPPEASVGQGSSQAGSSHSAPSPLTSNVSSVRKTTIAARRTS